MTDRHYRRPTWVRRRLVNPPFRILVLRGGQDVMRVLRVRGSRSGCSYDAPVRIATRDGKRYVLSMLGEALWVRNLRAAGAAQLLLGLQAEPVAARELHAQERAAFLTWYCQHPAHRLRARTVLRADTASLTPAEVGRGRQRGLEIPGDAEIVNNQRLARLSPVFRLKPAAAPGHGEQDASRQASLYQAGARPTQNQRGTIFAHPSPHAAPLPAADPRGRDNGYPSLSAATNGGNMEQPVNLLPLPASFGALLRARRHRACLSQEQLAARAELSERTVRNLEADRVQSPRTDTVRLLADALQLSEPEREGWFEAARGDPPEIAVQAWAGRAGRDAGTCDGGGLTSADGRELAELRRETRRLREDVEILKRAAAILAAAAPRPLWAGHENQPDAGEGEQDAPGV